MSKSSEKIVKVHLVQILLQILGQTLLQTVKNILLVIPQSKGKYDIMKIVELMKPRIPFVDVAIIVVLIRTFNEMVIELASGGGKGIYQRARLLYIIERPYSTP